MRNRFIILSVFVAFILTGCSVRTTDYAPGMFPDYSDITVPCNIAPLNFRMRNAGGIKVAVRGKGAEHT